MRLEKFLEEVGRVRVKICGITRKEDAQLVAESDCDAIGLNFYCGSSRKISLGQAEEIVKSAGDELLRVAVTVNAEIDDILEIWKTGFVDVFQLHGDENHEYLHKVQELGVPCFPAVRLASASQFAARVESFKLESGSLVLVDGWSAGAYGGTGHSIGREELIKLEGIATGHRCLLAGGLTPGNVGERLELFPAFGVDVASGVESSPGVKAGLKVVEFVKAVRKRG